MTSDPEHSQRLRDFEARTRHSPSSVLKHPSGWRYVPVHDFNASSIDAWCMIENDVYFVQFWPSSADLANREPGLYYRWSPGSPPLFNLVRIHDETAVSREFAEQTMSELAAELPPRDRPASLVRLGSTAA